MLATESPAVTCRPPEVQARRRQAPGTWYSPTSLGPLITNRDTDLGPAAYLRKLDQERLAKDVQRLLSQDAALWKATHQHYIQGSQPSGGGVYYIRRRLVNPNTA